MPHELAIVGPVSPPYGGVSVHVERFLPYLDRAGIDYVVYNTAGPTEIPPRVISVARRNRWWFLKYLLTSKEPVIYFQNSQWAIWAASWFLSRLRGKKVIFILHGEMLRMAWESHGPFVRRCIRRGFDRVSRVVAVSPKVRDIVLSVGDYASKTIVAPAFIPLPAGDDDHTLVTDTHQAFRRDHDPLILAMGAPVLHKGSTDLYGIDMTIEMVDHLRQQYPRIGVLWFLLDIIGSDPNYTETMRRVIAERGLGAHWMFSPAVRTLQPFYRMADLYVRPTCTDGDAISVREALHFGVPVITSDAASRPEGTVTFATRDQADLDRKVSEMLDDLPAARARLTGLTSDCAADRIVTMLQEVIAEVKRS